MSGPTPVELYWRMRAEYLAERILSTPPVAAEAIYWTARDVDMLASLAAMSDDSALAARLRILSDRANRR